MGMIQRFEDIQAWQKARELVRAIYHLTREGDLKHDFGLRNQVCRAAVSVMSNIAEGFGRKTDADFAHFLDMAKASTFEVQSLLYVMLDVGYIDEATYQTVYQQATETIRLIGGFAAYLRQQRSPRNLQPG